MTVKKDIVLAKFMGQSEDQCCGCSVAQSCLTLQPHELQHARLPWPSLSLRVCANSCPLSGWCHPTISPSVSPFSSCPQHFSVLYRELSKRHSCPQMPTSFRGIGLLVCKQKLGDNLIGRFYKDLTLWKRSRLNNICESWKSLSCVRFFATPWTLQSMEFSRPEYWSG